MKLAFASDHAGLSMRKQLAAFARDSGHEVTDFGPETVISVDYPDYAEKVGVAVARGEAALGVLVCGTGLGMSMAANKLKGIRAALCHTEFEARMARAHNDANVLCLGQRVTGEGVALAILDAFLTGAFEGQRHAMRVEKLRLLEGKHS